MGLNKFGKILFFIVAYSPLFFAFLIKYSILIKIWNCLGTERFYFVLGITIFLLIVIGIVLYLIEDMGDNSSTIEECEIIKSSNAEYLLFIMSYLVPFFGISLEFSDVIPTIFLLVIILCIYIDSSLLVFNPVLMIMGYNLVQAKYRNQDVILLSKNKLDLGKNNLRLIEFSENIYLVRE